MSKSSIAPIKLSGLYFTLEGGGVRIRITRRADLVRGRMDQQARRAADLARATRAAARMGRTIERAAHVDLYGVIDTASIDRAKVLRRVLVRVFCAPGSGDTFTAAQVADALTRCRKMGFAVHLPNDLPPKRVAAGHHTVIATRVVPEPMMAREELLHQLETYKPGPNRLQPGYHRAKMNMSELIGGLAAVKGKTEAQVLGAAHYRRVADRAQMGAARAVDYEQVKVDVSGPSEIAVVEIGADARREYYDATKRLGRSPLRLAVAERVILQGWSVSATAEAIRVGRGGTAREKVRRVVLDAADELATLFGYLPPRRATIRHDGDVPRVAETRREEHAEDA